MKAATAHWAKLAKWTSTAGALGVLLLPKCPLCFLGYASALASVGLDAASVWRWARGGAFVGAIASLVVVLWLSKRRQDPVPPAVGLSGAALLAGGACGTIHEIELGGLLLIAIATLLNARRCRASHPVTPASAPGS